MLSVLTGCPVRLTASCLRCLISLLSPLYIFIEGLSSWSSPMGVRHASSLHYFTPSRRWDSGWNFWVTPSTCTCKMSHKVTTRANWFPHGGPGPSKTILLEICVWKIFIVKLIITPITSIHCLI